MLYKGFYMKASSHRSAIIAIVFVLLAAGVAPAQSGRGSISGSVTDATGAVVPSVAI